ncbi:MAG: hypothetical protein ACK5PP_09760 [Acidimicrobiales bacterium]
MREEEGSPGAGGGLPHGGSSPLNGARHPRGSNGFGAKGDPPEATGPSPGDVAEPTGSPPRSNSVFDDDRRSGPRPPRSVIISLDGDTAPAAEEHARLFRRTSADPGGPGSPGEPIDGDPPHPDAAQGDDAPLFGPRPGRVVLGDAGPVRTRLAPALAEPPADWRTRMADLADRGWFTIALSGVLALGVVGLGWVVVQRQLTPTEVTTPATGFVASVPSSTAGPVATSVGTVRPMITTAPATSAPTDPSAPEVGAAATAAAVPAPAAPRRTTTTARRRTTVTEARTSQPATSPTRAPTPTPAPTPVPEPSPSPQPSEPAVPTPSPSRPTPTVSQPAPSKPTATNPAPTSKPTVAPTTGTTGRSTNRSGASTRQAAPSVLGPDTVLDQVED